MVLQSQRLAVNGKVAVEGILSERFSFLFPYIEFFVADFCKTFSEFLKNKDISKEEKLKEMSKYIEVLVLT